MNLHDIYITRTTPDGYGDKGTAHSYIEVYERLLAPMRETAKAVLEIGVGPQALSLRMWCIYFPNAEIAGIDPDPIREALPKRAYVLQANAYHAATALQFSATKFDLIVDDGSHLLNDQLAAVQLYRPLLAPEGLLIIEDVVDLDRVAETFHKAGMCEIHDLRSLKGRYDDVLIVYRGPDDTTSR